MKPEYINMLTRQPIETKTLDELYHSQTTT